MDREQVLFRLFGKYCPEGTILYTEGSPGQELYVIQSGAVRLGAARTGGAAAGLLGPGDLLGEDSFFVTAPRPTRAEVVQDARLIQLNDRTLEAVVRHGPQTARAVFERLLALTRSSSDELASWTVGQLLQRVAPNLSAAAGGMLPADLAEQTGLAVDEVELVLEELRQRGGLVREGPRYCVTDPARLRREIDGFAPPGERA